MRGLQRRSCGDGGVCTGGGGCSGGAGGDGCTGGCCDEGGGAMANCAPLLLACGETERDIPRGGGEKKSCG
eukprot:4205562-Prymnesium_polylepis.1